MAVKSYQIQADFQLRGQSISGATRQLNRVGHAARSITRELLTIAGLGGAGYAFGSLIRSGVKLNIELERSAYGISTLAMGLMEIKGLTPNEQFREWLASSRGITNELRLIAAKSLGTYKEYVDAYQLMLAPMLRAKSTQKEQLEMVKQLVPYAKSAGIPLMYAAIDVQQMLNGMSRIMDRLPKFLGINAKELNKIARQDPSKAFKIILEYLRRVEPATKAFGDTLQANWETFEMNVQYTMKLFTGPAVDFFTAKLIEANRWFEKNEGLVEDMVEDLGSAIPRGMDKIIKSVQWIGENFEEIKNISEAIFVFYMGKGVVASVAILANFVKLKATLQATAAIQGVGGVLGGGGVGVGVGAGASFATRAGWSGAAAAGGAGLGAAGLGAAALGGAIILGGAASGGYGLYKLIQAQNAARALKKQKDDMEEVREGMYVNAVTRELLAGGGGSRKSNIENKIKRFTNLTRTSKYKDDEALRLLLPGTNLGQIEKQNVIDYLKSKMPAKGSPVDYGTLRDDAKKWTQGEDGAGAGGGQPQNITIHINIDKMNDPDMLITDIGRLTDKLARRPKSARTAPLFTIET